jgi:hypothetical protein
MAGEGDAAAGPTGAGRRIVGSCPVQEEVVVVATRRGVDAVSPTRTVILTMEPLFAGLFGFLLAGGPGPARDRRRPAMIRP